MTPSALNISKIFFIFSIPLLLGNFAKAQDQAQTPPDASIEDIKMGGSGCEKARASAVISPDKKELSVLFDNYIVEIGNGSINPTANMDRKNCQIHIKINSPEGWQYAVQSADYRGFMNLPQGAIGTHRFAIMSQGRPVSNFGEARVMGPKTDVFTVHLDRPLDQLHWSNCKGRSKPIMLNSALAVQFNGRNSDRSIAQMILDSKDFSIRNSFGVQWRKCDPKKEPHPSQPDRPNRPTQPFSHF